MLLAAQELKSLTGYVVKFGMMKAFPRCGKKSVMVPVYKKDELNCDNYREISLLSQCNKVFADVLLQRIKQRTDKKLSEISQCEIFLYLGGIVSQDASCTAGV